MAFQALALGAASLGRIAPKALRSIRGGNGLEFAGLVAQLTLQRALAAALAPPGTSPPSANGSERAAPLQPRTAPAKTARGTTAGQQSEFSGNLLDAESAKETPAPQKTLQANAQDASSALLASLLNGAPSGATESGLPNAHAQTPAAPPAQPAGAQAPAPTNILTRMLARAANAQSLRGDAAAHLEPVPAPSKSSAGAAANPALLFERLLAVVAQQQADSQAGADAGKDQPQTPHAALPGSQAGNAAAVLPFAVQTANASVPGGSASSAPAPYALLDPQAVIEQIVNGISMRSSGGTSQVQLRLQPEHLGDVSLNLTVTGNAIAANIIAQNADVRDVLLGNQAQLARTLAEAGLTLGKFSVNVSGGNAGFSQQRSHEQTAPGRGIAVGGSLLAHDDDTWDDRPFSPVPRTGGSLVFNYLA